jgi:hypothetical protein
MKLRLSSQASSEPFPSHDLKQEQEEMAKLYARLAQNQHGDSESVRTTLLARMVFLTFTHLHRLYK